MSNILKVLTVGNYPDLRVTLDWVLSGPPLSACTSLPQGFYYRKETLLCRRALLSNKNVLSWKCYELWQEVAWPFTGARNCWECGMCCLIMKLKFRVPCDLGRDLSSQSRVIWQRAHMWQSQAGVSGWSCVAQASGGYWVLFSILQQMKTSPEGACLILNSLWFHWTFRCFYY